MVFQARQRWDACDAVVASRQVAPLEGQDMGQLGEGEGEHEEKDAAAPQDQDACGQGEAHRHQGCHRQRQPGPRRHMSRQEGGGVCPQPPEGGMAQGDHPSPADQQSQGQGCRGQGGRLHPEVKGEAARQWRNGGQDGHGR